MPDLIRGGQGREPDDVMGSAMVVLAVVVFLAPIALLAWLWEVL